MAEFDNLKLDNQLCFPLYATARSVVNLYTPFLKPLGITYTQYLVFLVLWEHDGISVGELCSKLYLDSGTITPLLKKMEEKGYIERKRSHDDERVVSVFLTAAGLAMRDQAKDIPAGVGQCIHLEPDEAVCLYSLLYKILGQKKQ